MSGLKRIAIALSGDVRSAVSALILKKKGYDVVGTFIKSWRNEDTTLSNMHGNIELANSVCNKLKIPFVEVDLSQECWTNVFEYAIADYNIGFLPDHRTLFNDNILFGEFHKYCLAELKVDAVATGHFVKTSFGQFLEHYESGKKCRIYKNLSDKNNDNTKALSRITQKVLSKSMFPVGELSTSQVENIAIENDFTNLLNEPKLNNKYEPFISKYLINKTGHVVDVDKNVIIGEHNGLHTFKRGDKYKDDFYIVDNNMDNVLFAAAGSNHPALLCRNLTLSSCHWIAETCSEFDVKKCHQGIFEYELTSGISEGTLVNLLDTGEYGFILLEMEKTIFAVSPGQYITMYEGDECIGSFRIEKVGPSEMFFQLNENSMKHSN